MTRSYPEDIFARDTVHTESAPLPADIPAVSELGASSAPLTSAAFFIGSECREFNDDYMLCRQEDNNPEHCLKEGRRVTRCASHVYD